MAHVPDLTSTKVPIVTIDAICSARGLEVDLIKIDTETTEPGGPARRCGYARELAFRHYL